MQQNSFLFTADKSMCSGCRACENVCHQQAISMCEDDEGFLYPHIDDEKCTHCGLCEKKCPMLHVVEKEHSRPRYFGVWAKKEDQELTQACATMGLSTMIAQHVLQRGGVVYGVVLNHDKQAAEHIRIEHEEQQPAMRNSKYMQSDVGSTYKQVKQDLLENRLVYYTGTPCQIAGLKVFLGQDYACLITMDLICHGVFSKKIYQEELKYWQNKYGGRIENFRFRGKGRFPYIIGGLVNFDVVGNGRLKGRRRHIDVPAKYSPLYYSYAYAGEDVNYILRPSCYDCKFRTQHRVGDITIGDFHFFSKYHRDKLTPDMERYGISLVIINSPKGQALFDSIGSRVNSFETTEKFALVQPALLGKPRRVPKVRQQIYDHLGKMPFEDLVRQYIFSDEYARTRNAYVRKYLIKINIHFFLQEHPQIRKIIGLILRRNNT